MKNYLTEIIDTQKKILANPAQEALLQKIKQKVVAREVPHFFRRALQKPGLHVIAEIKRKSPSKGMLNADVDPVKQALCYESGGADVISVLTNTPFFGGSIADLQQVKQAVHVPVLRKDFIVNELQLYETAFIGADVVLLIVAVLQKQTGDFIQLAQSLGLETLVEVHDETELEIALEAKAPVIGINNRSLVDFTVDVSRGIKIREKIPDSIITVAESGIITPQDARLCEQAGFNAILVGETLMRATDPECLVRELKGVS